jgi:drug/metabolite transporter (DMT)-like permease
MNAAPDKKPSTTAFVVAFAIIYLVWGSTYLGMRIAIETMPPFIMAATRFAIAGAILFLIVRLKGAPRPSLRQWRDNFIAGTFLLVGGNGMVAWSEQFLSSGIAALLLGASPVFMVLAEWAWPGGQRPTRSIFAGLALGFAGVAWLAAPWESASDGALDPKGLLGLLTACVSWSIGSMLSRHAKNPAPPFLASALQMLGGGTALAVVALLRGELNGLDPALFSARSWIALGYLTLIGSLVGFSTFVWLMKYSTPARVSTYAYVNPIVAVFLGWLILDEHLSTRTGMAAALIIAAVAIITVQKGRARLTAPQTNPDMSPPRPASAR